MISAIHIQLVKGSGVTTTYYNLKCALELKYQLNSHNSSTIVVVYSILHWKLLAHTTTAEFYLLEMERISPDKIEDMEVCPNDIGPIDVHYNQIEPMDISSAEEEQMEICSNQMAPDPPRVLKRSCPFLAECEAKKLKLDADSEWEIVKRRKAALKSITLHLHAKPETTICICRNTNLRLCIAFYCY